MTERDISLLKSRHDGFQKIIKDNLRLPKDQRDYKAMEEAKKRSAVLSAWMKGEDPFAVPEAPVKIEFKAKPNTYESIMVLDTVEELEKAWPNLWKKNIGVQGPDVVLQRLREMVTMYRNREKIMLKHNNNPTHYFCGVDEFGITWNKVYWHFIMRNTQRIKEVIELRLGVSLKSWKSFELTKTHHSVAGRRLK